MKEPTVVDNMTTQMQKNYPSEDAWHGPFYFSAMRMFNNSARREIRKMGRREVFQLWNMIDEELNAIVKQHNKKTAKRGHANDNDIS